MANLIITVIAIALVAVASLMGAYYGGSAFLNNQSAANASTVLNQGQQLVGAWDSYLGDNLNNPPATLTALTTGNYLQQIPNVPAGPNGVASAAMYVAKASNGHYYAYADMGKVANGATAGVTDTNASACIRIQKTATGQTPPSLGTVALGSIAAQGNGTFGCAISAAAPSGGLAPAGTPPASGDYVMEYLIQ